MEHNCSYIFWTLSLISITLNSFFKSNKCVKECIRDSWKEKKNISCLKYKRNGGQKEMLESNLYTPKILVDILVSGSLFVCGWVMFTEHTFGAPFVKPDLNFLEKLVWTRTTVVPTLHNWNCNQKSNVNIRVGGF